MSLVSEEMLDGKHARRAGLPKSANPHWPEGPKDWADWARGWEFEDRMIAHDVANPRTIEVKL